MLSSIRQILGAEGIVWVLHAKSTHCLYFTKNTCKLKMYWVYYTCSTKTARRLSRHGSNYKRHHHRRYSGYRTWHRTNLFVHWYALPRLSLLPGRDRRAGLHSSWCWCGRTAGQAERYHCLSKMLEKSGIPLFSFISREQGKSAWNWHQDCMPLPQKCPREHGLPM